MKAAVTTIPGSPEVIELQEKSIPSAKKGWVLIKIKEKYNESEFHKAGVH